MGHARLPGSGPQALKELPKDTGALWLTSKALEGVSLKWRSAISPITIILVIDFVILIILFLIVTIA